MIKWRPQYAGNGLAGLEDAAGPGGPNTVLTDEVVWEILAAVAYPRTQRLRPGAPGVHEFPDGLEAASAFLAAGHGGVPYGDGGPQSAIAVRRRCSG